MEWRLLVCRVVPARLLGWRGVPLTIGAISALGLGRVAVRGRLIPLAVGPVVALRLRLVVVLWRGLVPLAVGPVVTLRLGRVPLAIGSIRALRRLCRLLERRDVDAQRKGERLPAFFVCGHQPVGLPLLIEEAELTHRRLGVRHRAGAA